MKELLTSGAQSARLLPKPNKIVAVNFVKDRVESRQFELNLNLGMELIAGLKMAAGTDPESHKELQQGYFKVKYDGQETMLEIRSQGVFGGEKLYIIKRPVEEVKKEKGDEEVEVLKK
jgi:type II secretory ATPase GspE/PulE/Tfp pilus assembly ATPase PilB-like protein